MEATKDIYSFDLQAIPNSNEVKNSNKLNIILIIISIIGSIGILGVIILFPHPKNKQPKIPPAIFLPGSSYQGTWKSTPPDSQRIVSKLTIIKREGTKVTFIYEWDTKNPIMKGERELTTTISSDGKLTWGQKTENINYYSFQITNNGNVIGTHISNSTISTIDMTLINTSTSDKSQ